MSNWRESSSRTLWSRPTADAGRSTLVLLLVGPPAFVHQEDKSEASDNGEPDDDGEHEEYKGHNHESED